MSSIPGEAASEGMESQPNAQPSTDKSSGTMKDVQNAMFMFEEFQKDPHKMAFAAGIFVGILTLILLFLWSRGRGGLRKVKRAILVVGPSDAGKTLLFSQLLSGKAVETYTSMKENFGKYSGKSETQCDSPENDTALAKPMELYDLPGHDRLRFAALDKHKDEAKAIIYVVDASTIKQKLRDAAEFLFRLLGDSCLHSAGIPVMVVCNKQDVGLQAKGARVIERELAKEIGVLRETHANLLLGTDGSSATSDGSTVFLGKQGKDFEFSDLHANVEFCEASASKDCLNEDSGIPAIKRWIATSCA